jgi:hypothetical protein
MWHQTLCRPVIRSRHPPTIFTYAPRPPIILQPTCCRCTPAQRAGNLRCHVSPAWHLSRGCRATARWVMETAGHGNCRAHKGSSVVVVVTAPPGPQHRSLRASLITVKRRASVNPPPHRLSSTLGADHPKVLRKAKHCAPAHAPHLE